jgi:hypothetical protein
MDLKTKKWKQLFFTNEFKNDICGFSLAIDPLKAMAYSIGGYGNKL